MTIDEILSCRSCTELFPTDLLKAEKIYLDLMRKFHPDRCSDPKSAQATAVVNELYRRIRRKPTIQTLQLEPSGYYTTHCPHYSFEYVREYEREDGIMYYSDGSLNFVIEPELNSLLKQTLLRRASCHVPWEIENQMIMAFPKISEVIPLASGKTCVKVSVENGELPLDEVLNFYGKNLDSRHAAWIVSRLLGICCFAELSGTVLNCICTENLLINPEQHTVRLVGGWWFAVSEGEKMYGAQSEVYNAMPASCRTDGIARHITDLECVKAICRKIFPENSPEPLQKYSEAACSANAFTELEYWEEVIFKAFGGRFFTPMKLCTKDIYND